MRILLAATGRTVMAYVLPDIDLASARGAAEYVARLEEIGDELGAFTPLGPDHASLFVDGRDTLLVTFEEVARLRGRGNGDLPLGLALAARHGWSSLSVVTRAQRWFRDEEVLDFFDAQIDAAFFENFDRVIFYGSGMGGYAACALSVAAPGATVLAIAPQATLNPVIAGWDQRFPHARRLDFRSRFGFAPDMLDAVGQAFVLYDPSRHNDSMHATLFRRSFVNVIRCPRLGWDTALGLDRIGALEPLIEMAARGRLNAPRVYDLLRKRRTDREYLEDLVARAARGGHPALTVVAAQRAMALTPRRTRKPQLAATD